MAQKEHKPLSFKDITETTKEWILKDWKFKKFTLIFNIVRGNLFIKYGVYAGSLCVLNTEDRDAAIARFNSSEEKDTVNYKTVTLNDEEVASEQ